MPTDIASWVQSHKGITAGGAVGVVLAVGYGIAKRKQTTPQTAADYLTPNVLANVPTGETVTITGPGINPTPGGAGGTIVNQSPQPIGSGNTPTPVLTQPLPPSPSQPQIPQDVFGVGQLVNPTTGEYVTAAGFSPVFGWLNETNLGGIYTGGGGTTPISQANYGGSYLGYVGSAFGQGTDAANAERAAHGQFGTLLIGPQGQYTEVNTQGEKYTFGLAGMPGA